ncbi:secreted RxLR effector protein 161-like [Cicer arietinum]|uniref:secreted RxLR effector protein 161-like n=1 Tax=Cicer arietinum TaxID=3827 RepID=UPI003CC53368
MTRPNISYDVSVVSQFLNSPCDSHWNVVVKILRYIKGAPGKGLVYTNRGHSDIVAYTDADWAGSPSDRRSTSGKKQNVVARSSAEAEYRAMALTTQELIWLIHLLQELHFCNIGTMSLICDNQAALHIASNPGFHERTKHIEIDCHFVRRRLCLARLLLHLLVLMINWQTFSQTLQGPRITYICGKLDAYNLYALA